MNKHSPKYRFRQDASNKEAGRQSPEDTSAVTANSVDAEKTGLDPFGRDKAALGARYTPDQLRVIQAGEAAVLEADIIEQGRARMDPGGFPYLDDFSTIRPVIDKRIKVRSTIPVNARKINEADTPKDFFEWLTKIDTEEAASSDYQEWERLVQNGDEEALARGPKPRPTRLELDQYWNESTGYTGGGSRGTSVVAPALSKIPAFKGQFKKTEDVDARDPDEKYTRLIKQTGMTLEEILSIHSKDLVRHRVVNQTRLGKIASQYVLAIAGNGNGMLGIGEGKALEPEDANRKARQAAIRNMRLIPRYEERTIFGNVEAKVSAVEVTLMARPPGFGLRCHHSIFEMAKAAGIHDLAARVPRSRNKMNTIKATYAALMSQRVPDEVARGRGRKLVDVRKVYYGGAQSLPRLESKVDLRRSQNAEMEARKLADLQELHAYRKRVRAERID